MESDRIEYSRGYGDECQVCHSRAISYEYDEAGRQCVRRYCRHCEQTAELARLRAEVEKLRTMVDTMTQTNDEMFKLYEERGAEVEKLRADVVWAVRHGANASYDGDSHPAVWYEVDSSRMTRWGIPVTSVEYDGTDASLLSAVRRAREEGGE